VTRAWLLRRLAGDGRRHLTVWVGLALAFAVAGFAVAGASVLRPAPAAPAAGRVIAYLGDDVDGPRAAELASVLAKMPGVEAVRVVSAAEELELLRAALGARAGVVEGVGPDLLSPSLEIAARQSEAAALAFRLRRVHGVADVDLVTDPAPAAPLGAALAPRARLAVTLAGVVGLLALVAALARLRSRLRVEHALLLTLGLPRAACVRPAFWLATASGALGAGLGVLAAAWSAPAWLGTAPPAREIALGLVGLLVVALGASRAALRIPEAAGAG
jgi:hypothetical protein